MKYKKILVVYKKPVLDIYRQKGKKELEEFLAEGYDIKDLKAEVIENRITKKIVKNTLKADNVKVDWKYRAFLSKRLVNNYDLIITFGGDGTLLEAAHYIEDKPVLGVNSDFRPDDPDSSEGFFLAANKYNFEEVYQHFKRGKISEHKFQRLEVELNGKKLEEKVLDEVFISHKDPAATSRMVVKYGGIEEFQKSSGFIIATPASNWTIKAGGEVLPIDSDKFQYVAREICLGRLNPNPKLEKGKSKSLEVLSKMREGIISLDGKHVRYDFGLGAKLKVSISKKPLRILGFDEEKREKYYAKSC